MLPPADLHVSWGITNNNNTSNQQQQQPSLEDEEDDLKVTSLM